MSTRRISAALAAGIVLGLTTTGGAASAAQPVPWSQADFAGYATGTYLHADVLQAQGQRVVDAGAAVSGASVASKGLATQPAVGRGAKAGEVVDDLDRLIQPVQGGKKSFARGAPLLAGLGLTLPTTGHQLAPNDVAVAAPPVTSDQKDAQIPASPLAWASLARGAGGARWSDDTCVLGVPISMGAGYVADAQLIETGEGSADGSMGAPVAATDSAAGDRVVWTTSQTRVTPATDAKGKQIGAFGLTSETRETLLPVTLFKGTANEVTIRVAGVWRLAAVAGGVPGSARVEYGVDGNATTPVVTVEQGGVEKLVVTLEQLLGDAGIKQDLSPLLKVQVGGTPEQKSAADGTSASGSFDVVRVTLLDPDDQTHVTQVAVGHMEASARVPAGGIDCGLPVTKATDKDPVAAGEDFTYTITVSNPYECTLTDVTLVDELSGDEGVKWTVDGTTPKADSASNTRVTWNDIGPIAPGKSASTKIHITVASDSLGGRLTDHAVATAKCASGSADGGTGVVVPLRGEVTVTVPEVTAVSPEKDILAHTGGGAALPLAAGVLLLAGGGLALARRRSMTL